jgi:hypothetical protein
MNLEQLCKVFEDLQFPAQSASTHPEREAVLSARSVVATAVVEDDFLTDCFTHELRLIEANHFRSGLTPFLTMPNLGIRFAFGYWPPGSTPGPHEHTAWTITAVCRNQLEVLTFDRAASYQRRQLVPKNRFHATAGQVGYIYEPCIHEPRNTSPDWSLSLHITSPRDGEPVSNDEEPLSALMTSATPLTALDHPYTQVMIARQRHRFVAQLSRILASMTGSQVSNLLTRCYQLADATTRSWLVHTVPQSIGAEVSETPWMLARIHRELVLSPRPQDGMVVLEAEAPHGSIDEIIISDKANAALSFIVNEPSFAIDALPGDLSKAEKLAFAQVLESTGLFSRVLL